MCLAGNFESMHDLIKILWRILKVRRIGIAKWREQCNSFFLIHLVKQYPKTWCVPQLYLGVVKWLTELVFHFNNFLSFVASKKGHTALSVRFMIVLIKLIKHVSDVHQIRSPWTQQLLKRPVNLLVNLLKEVSVGRPYQKIHKRS